MNTLLDLSLHDQGHALEFGLGIPEDLVELAADIRSNAPSRIEFAQDKLQEPKQSEEYYRAWARTVELWRKAFRLSDPAYNCYLKQFS